MLDAHEDTPRQIDERLAALGLVDPTARSSHVERRVAPRLTTLVGKTVGLLDNRKGNGDRLLDHVGLLLKTRYEVADVYEVQKFTYSRRAETELLDQIVANSHFAVTAIGD